MITNGNITIINRGIDPETRTQTYTATIIEDVYFERAAGLLGMNNGNLRDDKAFAIIYKNNEATADYKRPNEYEQAAAGWTLRTEDYMVLGGVEGEITSIKELKKLDDVYEISKVEEYATGLVTDHWEVFGR